MSFLRKLRNLILGLNHVMIVFLNKIGNRTFGFEAFCFHEISSKWQYVSLWLWKIHVVSVNNLEIY